MFASLTDGFALRSKRRPDGLWIMVVCQSGGSFDGRCPLQTELLESKLFSDYFTKALFELCVARNWCFLSISWIDVYVMPLSMTL